VTRLLLFPGSGTDRNHSSLLAVEAAVAPMPVTRADFPYRAAGRRAPDRAPVLLRSVRDEASALLDVDDRLVLGGRSMGGRICSMVVAGIDDGEPRVKAKALVLIAYPLHPPGKPDKLRVEHFQRLKVPCLFVSGTRDAFGAPDELTEWTATIPGKVTHVWFEGKGHDLKGCDDRIADAVRDWISRLPGQGRRGSGPRARGAQSRGTRGTR
jgi:predicted alpha/beta-hydrolase family hydrolase